MAKIKKIITHAGSAHRDDFLAVCIALSKCGNVPSIERRDPSPEELDNPEVLVLDVGRRHEPELNNFDHHQLERDAAPACALSLYTEHLGYDFSVFEWYAFTVLLDSKGPAVVCKEYGIGDLNPTLSPVENALKSLFEADPMDVAIIMARIGSDLCNYHDVVKAQIDEARTTAYLIEVEDVVGMSVVKGEFEDNKVYEPVVLNRLRAEAEESTGKTVAFQVTKDDRGAGYTLYRYDDHPRVDFSKLEEMEDITFAHKGGFIAKTSRPMNSDRIRSFILSSLVTS